MKKTNNTATIQEMLNRQSNESINNLPSNSQQESNLDRMFDAVASMRRINQNNPTNSASSINNISNVANNTVRETPATTISPDVPVVANNNVQELLHRNINNEAFDRMNNVNSINNNNNNVNVEHLQERVDHVRENFQQMLENQQNNINVHANIQERLDHLHQASLRLVNEYTQYILTHPWNSLVTGTVVVGAVYFVHRHIGFSRLFRLFRPGQPPAILPSPALLLPSTQLPIEITIVNPRAYQYTTFTGSILVILSTLKRFWRAL